MDRDAIIEDLKRRVQEFCEVRDWDQFHRPKELAIGVVTEASELLELFRFLSDEECLALVTDTEGRLRIEEELADVLFFVLRFSQLFGIDLDEAFRRKLEITATRYPVEKARGSNVKYSSL